MLMKVSNNTGSNIEALLPGLEKPVEIPPQGTQNSLEGRSGDYSVTTQGKRNIAHGSFAALRSVSIAAGTVNVVSSHT